MWLDVLPVDALHAISSFLSGFDVFQLSHTNSWTLSVLSDNLYWQQRVTKASVAEPRTSWKRRYLQERSLLFVDPDSAKFYIHGMRLGNNRSRLAFAKLDRPAAPGAWRGSRFDLSSTNGSSFSFDVWFSLLPGTHKQPAGGVIYGLQSASATVSRAPLALVDTKRDLYCSVLSEKKAVARGLKPNCWYHAALAYDVDLQRQEVYVDGKLVSIEEGPLDTLWQRPQQEQVGTGYCDEATRATGAQLPHTRFRGGAWYSFYGFIDEFRVWNAALPSQAVAELARGGQPAGFSIVGTMKRDRDRRGSWSNTHAVRCTRPAEGTNAIVDQREQFH
jgi:hypothetical protein